MLKKEKMIPGSQIKVRDVIKTGIPAVMFGDSRTGGSREKDHIALCGVAGGFFDGGVGVRSGTVLTVVKGPKKYLGVNCACVRVEGHDDVDFYGYWCELRVSCDHV